MRRTEVTITKTSRGTAVVQLGEREVAYMRGITERLKKVVEDRERWFAHVKKTMHCYCGMELAEPVGLWTAEHICCAEDAPSESQTSEDP